MIQQSFTDVRNHLNQVLQTLEETQEPVGITKHGVVCAMMVPANQFSNQTGFMQKLEAWQEKKSNLISKTDENPFDGVRSEDSGRDFSW